MASISYNILSAGATVATGSPAEVVAGVVAPVASSRCSFHYDQTLYREKGQILRDLDSIRQRIDCGDYNFDATTIGALTGAT